MAARALVDALERHGMAYELIPHRHTRTAAAEARVVGVLPDITAKTVIVRSEEGFVRVVVPASRRVDLGSAASALGVEHVELASEAELAGAYPAFELGAVPPFDALYEDPAVVDAHLARLERVVFDAGTHQESVRMRGRDLLLGSHGVLADVCEPLDLAA
jgi:Ala-tRNA(Pro) deacylase